MWGFRGGFRGDSFSIGKFDWDIVCNKVIDLYKLSDISVLRVVKTEQILSGNILAQGVVAAPFKYYCCHQKRRKLAETFCWGQIPFPDIFDFRGSFARLSRGFRGNSSGLFDFPLKHLLFSAAAAAGWCAAAGWLAGWLAGLLRLPA